MRTPVRATRNLKGIINADRSGVEALIGSRLKYLSVVFRASIYNTKFITLQSEEVSIPVDNKVAIYIQKSQGNLK